MHSNSPGFKYPIVPDGFENELPPTISRAIPANIQVVEYGSGGLASKPLTNDALEVSMAASEAPRTALETSGNALEKIYASALEPQVNALESEGYASERSDMLPTTKGFTTPSETTPRHTTLSHTTPRDTTVPMAPIQLADTAEEEVDVSDSLYLRFAVDDRSWKEILVKVAVHDADSRREITARRIYCERVLIPNTEKQLRDGSIYMGKEKFTAMRECRDSDAKAAEIEEILSGISDCDILASSIEMVLVMLDYAVANLKVGTDTFIISGATIATETDMLQQTVSRYLTRFVKDYALNPGETTTNNKKLVAPIFTLVKRGTTAKTNGKPRAASTYRLNAEYRYLVNDLLHSS